MSEGLLWRNGAAGGNKYQFNGKEWNDDFGLGWNDYGARFYDPAVGRWGAIDPLAEKRTYLSSYQYVQNNPLKLIDPTGMLDQSFYGRDIKAMGEDIAERAKGGEFNRNHKAKYDKVISLINSVWNATHSGSKGNFSQKGATISNYLGLDFSVQDNRYGAEVEKGDLDNAIEFLEQTISQVTQHLGKLIEKSQFDGGLKNVESFINYFRANAGSYNYSFKDKYGYEGLFSGIEAYVLPDFTDFSEDEGGPRDPLNKQLIMGFYQKRPSNLDDTYDPYPLAINNAISRSNAALVINRSHYGWIRGKNIMINFYLSTNVAVLP